MGGSFVTPLGKLFFLDLKHKHIGMKNNKQRKNSRRDFLKKGLVASTIMIVPRHVLGGTGYIAPSDQLNIASIGCGVKVGPI